MEPNQTTPRAAAIISKVPSSAIASDVRSMDMPIPLDSGAREACSARGEIASKNFITVGCAAVCAALRSRRNIWTGFQFVLLPGDRLLESVAFLNAAGRRRNVDRQNLPAPMALKNIAGAALAGK